MVRGHRHVAIVRRTVVRQHLALTLISFMLWGCATTIGLHGPAPSTALEDNFFLDYIFASMLK